MKFFVIPGDPIAWKRAAPLYQKRIMYDYQSKLKEVTRSYIDQQMGNDDMFINTPLHLDITFYMPVPDSLSEKKKEKLYGTYHKVKPDSSNLQKYYEDCCSKIVYYDDCLIASTSTKKIYDKEPRVEFSLRVL